MRDPDHILLAMGVTVLAAACGIYIRKRLHIRRVLRNGEPIAVDGWNTFPAEPEFADVVRSQQNEAFGQFCQIALYGLFVFAAAYGIDIRPDVFAFLMDH